MAMLGLQAEMQCHYFRGYCSSRDLNLNASCNDWPSNDVDKILKNGHYCNTNLAPLLPDEHLTYKEKLKQTMLQHEAIFKDQIRELHRLYGRQRQLMDEMKRIQLHGHHLQRETSQSNKSFCEPSYEYLQNTCKVSALPWLNPACSQSSVAGAENHHFHVNYVEGKIKQVGCSTVQTEGYRNESGLLDSKCKKFGKKILDLELPAYEYIDIDSEQEASLAGETVCPEVPVFPMKSIADDVQRSDVKITHGIELVSQHDNVTQIHQPIASFSRKINCLADLNEPINLEEEQDFKSNDFPSPIPNHREIACPDLSGRNSDFQVQPKETVQNNQTRGDIEAPEAFSNALDLENNESRPENLSDNDETGQSSGMNSFPGRICAETLSTSSSDDEIEPHHGTLTSHRLDLNSRILRRKMKDFDLENYPGKVSSSEIIPLDDVMTYDSSWRKHTREFVRAPIAVQALPCFKSPVHLNRSSKFRSPPTAGNKSCYGTNFESKPKFSSPSTQSSFCHSGNEFASEDNGTKKGIKSSEDLKWTRDIDLNSMSPSCSSDVAVHSICITDGEDKCKDSKWDSLLHRANPANLAKSNKKLDLDCNSVPDSEEQLTANDLVLKNRHDRKSSRFGFHVDLNSCINEDESSPMPGLSTEVDLQAPASPENKESSPPRGESDENQLETPCQLLAHENKDLLEDLMTVAAEAIVSISSSHVQTSTESVTIKPSEASQNDSLYWFSKIASRVVDDPESEFGVVLSFKETVLDDEYLSDGMDYFEAMTLNLKEINVEEYFCNTSVQKEEAACPVPLPSQPRRGRTRRGRQQRKDFQSEILPSLASLSRYEVTEDLQAIGGLIEAAHQSSGARRAGRNGWTRGRRRRPSISSSTAETSMCTLLKHQNKQGKCSIEEMSLIGWGKITRRRRGQRCPASNPRLILGQV